MKHTVHDEFYTEPQMMFLYHQNRTVCQDPKKVKASGEIRHKFPQLSK